MNKPPISVTPFSVSRHGPPPLPASGELPPRLARPRIAGRRPGQGPPPIVLLLALLLGLCSARLALAQGTLTNGWTTTGTIAPVGDSDSWTFQANTGDRIVVRVGKITQTNSFNPRLRLQTPNAVQQAIVSGSIAAEIAVTATNSGTFTVIVDDEFGTSATGTYRLTLAKSPGTFFVAPGDEGGPMTNGVMNTGTIDVGDLDVWTFTANAGDAIVVRMGKITDTSGNFTPWVRLYAPDGTPLGSSFNVSVAEVTVTATNSGAFSVVVGDGNGALSGTGTYRLTLAKTGDPVVISPGEQGGPMTNGVMHLGTISTGALELWTFSANTGDALVVRIGKIVDSSGNFEPWIRLYSPGGKLLGSSFGVSAGEITVTATNSGMFLVVAGDGNGALSGSGDYRLTLVKTGDPVVISPGDDGGPMTNGVRHLGTILTGDLDPWTFSANTGDAIVVRIGMITDTNTFTPWVRIYGPNGKLLGSGFGSFAGEVAVTATNTGTFIVVASDGNGALSGAGDYRLTLVKTGDPVVISPGDDGGPMTNGVTNGGTILTGDLDPWTFSANAGDALIVRIGKITDTNTFTPWVRLYGPNGKLLGSGFGSFAGEVAVTATNSGTFIVVASDGNGAFSGSGQYRLTLAKTGAAVVISPGDQGGALNGAGSYAGTLDVGELDVYYFTACVGDSLLLQMDESVNGSSLTPWLRLYGRDGALIRSAFGAATAQISVQATNAGVFILVAADGTSGFSGSGTYQLTANGLSAALKLCTPILAGTNVNLAGVGGPVSATFVLVTQTNVATPLNQWTRLATNQFDQFGVFTQTNVSKRSDVQRFFHLIGP
jgi:trimeric autotransporter adhesin